jgi:deazaflavin-dependent oxidoreductase (nitroreductase family)
MGEVRKSTEREQRLLKPFVLAMSAANKWVLRVSGGRLGGNFLRGAPVGVLTTVGRKSAQRRTTPLIYLADGARIVIVASLGGMPKSPLWYANLVANPDVEFEPPRQPKRRYRARTATADEKSAYWPRLCAIYPDYADYQARTDRDIPVVLLDPI